MAYLVGDMIVCSLVLYLIVCLVTWVSIVTYKKLYLKKSVHIVGNPKNFIVLRDKRLIPALWKQYTWSTWATYSASYAFMGIYLIVTYSTYKGVAITVIGIIAIVIFLILWSKSKTDFYRLKDELGIVLERDEEVVNSIIKRPYWRNRHTFMKFVIICSVFSIFFFINGDILMGALIAIFLAYEIIEFKKYR